MHRTFLFLFLVLMFLFSGIGGTEAATMHQVCAGDTLWSLAQRYGLSVEKLAQANGLCDVNTIRAGEQLLIPVAEGEASYGEDVPQPISWSQAQLLFPHAAVARVVDVQTGRAFQVKRYHGHLHADVEPLTAEDTAVMRNVYGEWSWLRRPIVVEIAGKRIAASMNGFPHGQGVINNNGFPGHFCIHFADCRIHKTGNVDPDHQAAVRAAVQAFIAPRDDD